MLIYGRAALLSLPRTETLIATTFVPPNCFFLFASKSLVVEQSYNNLFDVQFSSARLIHNRDHHHQAPTSTSTATMKFLTPLAIFVFSTLAVAQNLSGEPSCAVPCIQSGISAAGCNPTDVGCQCGPAQDSIANVVATCLLSACPASLLSTIIAVGTSLCSEYSASLTAISGATSRSVAAPLTTMGGPISTMWNSTTAAATQAGTGTITGTITSTPLTPVSTSVPVASPSSSKAAAVSNTVVGGLGGLIALFLGALAAL